MNLIKINFEKLSLKKHDDKNFFFEIKTNFSFNDLIKKYNKEFPFNNFTFEKIQFILLKDACHTEDIKNILEENNNIFELIFDKEQFYLELIPSGRLFNFSFASKRERIMVFLVSKTLTFFLEKPKLLKIKKLLSEEKEIPTPISERNEVPKLPTEKITNDKKIKIEQNNAKSEMGKEAYQKIIEKGNLTEIQEIKDSIELFKIVNEAYYMFNGEKNDVILEKLNDYRLTKQKIYQAVNNWKKIGNNGYVEEIHKKLERVEQGLKEADNSENKSDNDNKNPPLKEVIFWIIFVFVALVTIIIITAIYYRNKKKT